MAASPAQPITPELRAWIIEQAATGISAPALIDAMTHSGWREEVEDGGVAEWVQPTGAHDAYMMDAVVTHNGKTWISTVDSNVWEPGVHGWEEYSG